MTQPRNSRSATNFRELATYRQATFEAEALAQGDHEAIINHARQSEAQQALQLCHGREFIAAAALEETLEKQFYERQETSAESAFGARSIWPSVAALPASNISRQACRSANSAKHARC